MRKKISREIHMKLKAVVCWGGGNWHEEWGGKKNSLYDFLAFAFFTYGNLLPI